jgi:hypothetical protein
MKSGFRETTDLQARIAEMRTLLNINASESRDGKSGTDGTSSAFERRMTNFDESPEIEEHPDANRPSARN